MSRHRSMVLPTFFIIIATVTCFADRSSLPDPEEQPEFYANKWLVITKTETSREKCTCENGVVLNTDYYEDLKDGLFVCVEYVTQTQQSANQKKQSLSIECYIKKSGTFRIEDLKPRTAKTTSTNSDPKDSITSKSPLSTPLFIKQLEFSNKSSHKLPKNNNFEINQSFSGNLEVFYDSMVEYKISNIKIDFSNKSSKNKSSTSFIIESTDPLYYLPQVNVYSLQKDLFLFSFEYSDDYFPYLHLLVVNSNTQIEYTGKYDHHRMVGVELKETLSAVILTQSLDTICKVWKNNSFK